MSSAYRIMRERWAARSMMVTQWRVHPPNESFRAGDVICQGTVDGKPRDIIFPGDESANVFFPHYHYVAEGSEVGPFGYLLEYSEHGPGYRDVDPPHGPLVRRDRYPRIFLNYRRNDSEAYAGRLHESLSSVFGADEVFMDQFSIRPGEIYPWVIQQAAAHCDVMVTIIGRKWLTDENAKKLQSESDFLHREVVAALDRGTQIIPILVERAEVPDPQRLPYDMRRLSERQMLELSARHWQTDVEALRDEIRRIVRG